MGFNKMLIARLPDLLGCFAFGFGLCFALLHIGLAGAWAGAVVLVGTLLFLSGFEQSCHPVFLDVLVAFLIQNEVLLRLLPKQGRVTSKPLPKTPP